MERREFISLSGYGILGLCAIPSPMQKLYASKSMKAKDLQIYLRSLIEVDEPSVDQIIVGDPETIIQMII